MARGPGRLAASVVAMLVLVLTGCGDDGGGDAASAGDRDATSTTLPPDPAVKAFVEAAHGQVPASSAEPIEALVAQGRTVCRHAAQGDGSRASQDLLINDHHVDADDDTGTLARLAVQHLCPEQQRAVDDAIAFDRLMKGTPGGGSGSGTAPPPSGGGDLCAAARAIREIDDRSSMAMQGVMGEITSGRLDDLEEMFVEALRQLQALLPELTARYGQLEAAVPREYEADVRTLRDFTIEVMGQLADASSVDDFMTKADGMDVDDAMAAAGAAIRLNELTDRECGFPLST